MKQETNRLKDNCNLVEVRLNLTAGSLTKKTRKREVVLGRWIMFSYLRQVGLTLVEIASLFNMHHTNVVYGLRECMTIRENDYPYDREYRKIMGELILTN